MKKKQLMELLRATQEALAALQAAQAVQQVEDGRTLNEWMDVHEQQIREKGLKPPTVGNRLVCCAHVRRLWGTRPLRAIKAHELSSALRADFWPGAPSTGHRVLAEVRDAYSNAIANAWTEVNPAAHVKLPVHRVQRKRLRFETWQEMLKLSHSLPQRWVECLLLLGIVTGQRRADLMKMRFDDVVDGHLLVEQQKQAGKGYGARVAIPLALRLDAIGMTVGDVIERCRSCGKPGAALLRKANGGPLKTSSLSNRFHELIVATLGSDAYAQYTWPSLHEVRSLSARLYKQQSFDIETVQALLGHKDPEMTAVYVDDRGLTAREWKRVAIPA